MNFLIDNQLPPALARYWESHGWTCQHVQEVGLAEASDTEIWAYANHHACVLFSKDEDFLYLAKSRPGTARLVWVRIGNCRTHILLAAIERMRSRIEVALASGAPIVEVR